MKTNAAGVELIKRHEGLRLQAYRCPAGVWTIGYGHTMGVKPGDAITEARAEELFQADLVTAETAVVRALWEVTPNENQFAALVSFTFNVGAVRFRNSTLRQLVLEQRWERAAQEFDRWVWAGGVVLPGLVERRRAERELFLAPPAGGVA